MAERIICPVHGILDCSPLLNGCSEVTHLLAEDAGRVCPDCQGTRRCSDMTCWCLTDVCHTCNGSGRMPRG